MKKKATIIIIATIIVLNIFTAFINISGKSNVASNPQNKEQREIVYKYCVKDYGGKIAVFEYGKTNPVEIFDVYIQGFPEGDRQLLSEGIYAKDGIELQCIIEDYIG